MGRSAGNRLRLTPKGLPVSDLTWRTAWRNASWLSNMAEAIIPSAPAFEIAATNAGPEICIMHPPTMGCSMPNSSVMRVLNMVRLLCPNVLMMGAATGCSCPAR